jgi:quercetin dioxygenase-like cupin family protein
MPRTISVTKRFMSEQVAAGVFVERLHPGGLDGPNSEVASHFPGGQVWSEVVLVGDAQADPFQLGVPDIRLPANQIWPLHWHDCWVAVVVLDGECLIGDWWMKPGDVLITAAGVEYGPLVIGPHGCRMFEIFAKLHLQSGGYAPEYRDHPTLQHGAFPFNFMERSNVNKRNEGRQTLPIDGVDGLVKGRLTNGAQWDLGERSDPERGVMRAIALSPGEVLPMHRYSDWHALIVIEGQALFAGLALVKDAYVLAQANCQVNELRAGKDGVLLLEVIRTARGMAA